MHIPELLEENPIIAAVRTEDDFRAAIAAPPRVIFLLSGHILSIPEQIRTAHACGKAVLVHLDLADGVGKDRAGVEYLSRIGTDGVISTRSTLIRQAKDCGLCTVQRFFTVDSHSVDTALDSIRSAAPDLVELMPGVIPKTVQMFCARCAVPVIAGGLIDGKDEILSALGAGAVAVSTGKTALWDV